MPEKKIDNTSTGQPSLIGPLYEVTYLLEYRIPRLMSFYLLSWYIHKSKCLFPFHLSMIMIYRMKSNYYRLSFKFIAITRLAVMHSSYDGNPESSISIKGASSHATIWCWCSASSNLFTFMLLRNGRHARRCADGSSPMGISTNGLFFRRMIAFKRTEYAASISNDSSIIGGAWTGTNSRTK